MSINRTARRIDANQTQIVKALRQAGCAVAIVGKPIEAVMKLGEAAFKAVDGVKKWVI